jgi:hypothetical protein
MRQPTFDRGQEVERRKEKEREKRDQWTQSHIEQAASYQAKIDRTNARWTLLLLRHLT